MTPSERQLRDRRRAANRAAVARYRARQRAGQPPMVVEPKPCGTFAAAKRHYKQGKLAAVKACPDGCYVAWKKYRREAQAQYRRQVFEKQKSRQGETE